MKRLLCFACVACAAIIFASCEKKDSAKEPELGSLYGVITDKATGEPVKNAGVELMPLGLKAVTGDDGQFEFIKVEEGTYNLYITKSGYKDQKTNNISVKGDNKSKPVNILLEKLPPALSILDDKGNEVDSLDFGENPEVLMHSFFIFNRGEETLEWAIVHQCAWISSVSKESGTLASNGTQPLVIQIDRNKLSEGLNFTTVHVVSNSGTRQITLSAAFNVKLETLPVTDICTNHAVMNGRISQDFSPTITEYGFVYGTFFAPSIQNGAKKASLTGTPSIGAIFNILVSDLDEDTQYHVRAYATNGARTMYGEDIVFSTKDGKPTVVTISPDDNITANSITTGGNVTDDGGFPIIARGVVYGTVPYPILENNSYTTDGTGVGYFGSQITDVNVTSSTYYIRAYATNEKGTAYGEQVIVTPEKYDYCVNLKTMEFGGYTYRIKPLGGMVWQEGYDACENMIYGGYDDWFMPNVGEVEAILRAYRVWNVEVWEEDDIYRLKIHGNTNIWTSSSSNSGSYHYYSIWKGYGASPYKWHLDGEYNSGRSGDQIYEVIAVRKYIKK